MGTLKVDGNINITGSQTNINYGTPQYCSGQTNISATTGLNICQGANESSGIQLNGDYITMWSPADSYCLRYYDEDTGNEIWNINSSGLFSGTAAAANSVNWANVSGKPSSFTPSSHTHSYVPLSGGSMSGQLSISINNPGTSPSTQHIILNGQNGSSAVANAPGLAMHIGNMNWSTLKFLSDGSWRFYNSACNGYMPIYCSKTVVTNYGGTLPSSGVTGEIFYKT